VRLTGDEGGAFAALGDLIDAADVKREEMAATSFDVALSKFNRSNSSDSPYEHLVDLATALEAALIGAESETECLTLRLRNRTSALLATDDDPARALFDDVGLLYGLRSKLVHGGQIKQKDLQKTISRISTVPSETIEHRFGVALGHAVDRMRDLVRRAILARVCVAAGPEPLWAFAGDLATVEEDGTINLLGRGSSCINSGGEKIYPEEVEDTLKSHPSVYDALVVGAPDERWGERVTAVVQARPGTAPTLEELQEHCRRQLAGYKVPRQVHLVDQVQRQPSGKPDYKWAKSVAAGG